MIKIKNLEVWIDDKKILKWINLEFELWKNYCLLWKNGSGKSTLFSFLMWHPKYKYISWEVKIDSENLLLLSSNERSEKWLFLSFQHVPEIKGISLLEYLRTIYNIHLKKTFPDIQELSPFIFKRFIKKHLNDLNINKDFLNRELNVWFSGWEKRKIEILQMKLIWPKYIILDEIDSWLDLDSFKQVVSFLKNLSNSNNTLIVITHYFKILEYINVDKVYLIKDWKIIKEWDKTLIDDVKKTWFENL